MKAISDSQIKKELAMIFTKIDQWKGFNEENVTTSNTFKDLFLKYLKE